MLTTFIGVNFEERNTFLDEQEHENQQIKEIADRFDRRIKKRNGAIKKLRAELERLEAEIEQLEAKSDADRKIWHAAMDRHIARNRYICKLFDELKEAQAS